MESIKLKDFIESRKENFGRDTELKQYLVNYVALLKDHEGSFCQALQKTKK